MTALALSLAGNAQDIDSNNWEGHGWDHNIDTGAMFPPVNAGVATLASTDFSWVQLRSKATYTTSLRTTLTITAKLSSGGINGDAAYLAFGDQWVQYGGSSVGISLHGGRVYIYDYAAGGDQTQIGTYIPGASIPLTLDYSLGGFLQVAGPNIAGSYQSKGIPSPFRFIIANKDSTDGILVGGIATKSNSTAQPIGTDGWLGNRWSFNNNQGSWFPPVSAGVARFQTDDFSWGQLRTKASVPDSIRATFEVNPSLSSGGVNGDRAHFSFGNQWVVYGEPAVGIVFMNGKVYFWDLKASVYPGGNELVLGTYQPGVWVPVTMDLTSRGVLRVSGPGFTGTLRTTNTLSAYSFIMAVGNSSDGAQVRNVSIGPSGNIGLSVEGALYFGVSASEGLPGQTYRILSTLSLNPPVVWQPETTFTQTDSGFFWVDTNAPANGPRKFYSVAP